MCAALTAGRGVEPFAFFCVMAYAPSVSTSILMIDIRLVTTDRYHLYGATPAVSKASSDLWSRVRLARVGRLATLCHTQKVRCTSLTCQSLAISLPRHSLTHVIKFDLWVVMGLALIMKHGRSAGANDRPRPHDHAQTLMDDEGGAWPACGWGKRREGREVLILGVNGVPSTSLTEEGGCTAGQAHWVLDARHSRRQQAGWLAHWDTGNAPSTSRLATLWPSARQLADHGYVLSRSV